MTKVKKKTVMIIYIILFYSLWTGFELIIKDFLNSVILDANLCQFVKSGIIKNSVWTLPAILLVKQYQNDVSISLKEMFTVRRNWIKYLPVLALFTIYLLVGAL